MQKLLIIAGIFLLVLGLLYPFLKQLGLGNLPGDIVIKRSNFSFYFPIMTCIIVSVILSLILWLFGK